MFNLSGLTVLVTRPKPQGEILCHHIREAGGEAIYFPTVTIQPVEDQMRFKQHIAALNQNDWVIFISPQAVYQSAAAIFAAWPSFPSRLKVAAIGPGTAKALQENNIPVTIFPKTDWRSEGLLDLEAFQKINDRQIALITGGKGRYFLSETIRAQGAIVTEIVAYVRSLPKLTFRVDASFDWHDRVHVMVCTSNEILQNLITLLAKPTFDFYHIPLIVVSERMLKFANKLGFIHIFLATNASHDAIMAVLSAEKDQLWQLKKKK